MVPGQIKEVDISSEGDDPQEGKHIVEVIGNV